MQDTTYRWDNREPSHLNIYFHEIDLAFCTERSWPERLVFEIFRRSSSLKNIFNYFPWQLAKLVGLATLSACILSKLSFFLLVIGLCLPLAGTGRTCKMYYNSEKNAKTKRDAKFSEKHSKSKPINFYHWSIILYSWLDTTGVSVNQKNRVSCSAYLGEHLENLKTGATFAGLDLSIFFYKIPILLMRQYLWSI